MDQSTHAWIASRAVALFEDNNEAPGLLQILKPQVKAAAVGAWIPDLQDSKKGSGDLDNHVLKMLPYKGDQKSRFTVPKKELLKQLGPVRLMSGFLEMDKTLDDKWWCSPYKAEPKPGQHLADRAMALTTTIVDQLILGDEEVADAVPGTVGFSGLIAPRARTRKEQIATYFFMLSHFVADSTMPCHTDGRHLTAYKNGLHKELEKHWSKTIGKSFDQDHIFKDGIKSADMLKEARGIDEKFSLKFPKTIPAVKATDIWKEMISVCRASFALSCIMAPVCDYPFNSKKKAPFKSIFSGEDGKSMLGRMDQMIMHDAVLNVAMVWKHLWEKF